MKVIKICIIIFILIIGTCLVAYCGSGSSTGGGYKGSGSNYGGGDYKGGGGDKVKTDTPTYSTTLGQELIDLETAYKKGIINKEEYNEIKKIIIEQRTKQNK